MIVGRVKRHANFNCLPINSVHGKRDVWMDVIQRVLLCGGAQMHCRRLREVGGVRRGLYIHLEGVHTGITDRLARSRAWKKLPKYGWSHSLNHG